MKITFILPRADPSGGVRVISVYAKRPARAAGDQVVVVSVLRRASADAARA